MLEFRRLMILILIYVEIGQLRILTKPSNIIKMVGDFSKMLDIHKKIY
jgi:hypothetical protein